MGIMFVFVQGEDGVGALIPPVFAAMPILPPRAKRRHAVVCATAACMHVLYVQYVQHLFNLSKELEDTVGVPCHTSMRGEGSP